MSFKIERSHIVFKHIIHVGPEIDADRIVDIATQKDYTESQRQLQTPTGPLQEFLFRPKTNPQSLIVFSRKGFVIDAQPSDNVLLLFRDAYDFYEKVMGDDALTTTVVMDINSTFEVFSQIPVTEFLNKLYKDESSNLNYDGKELRPFGITLASGSGKFPDEFMQFSVQPLPKDPDRRLMVIMLYRSTELDDALKFIEKIDTDIVKTLEKISSLK
ncbi:MAG: hypothetical protein JXA54_12070 [Candidatus Heimdallarchaeota archaeon]|nr:hypothetical protein [Candidatus Heimdallarchaeota archaeon]